MKEYTVSAEQQNHSSFPPLQCCRVVLLHPVIWWTADLCFVIKQEPWSDRRILIVQILIALLKDCLGEKKGTKYETDLFLYLTIQIHKNI